MRKNGAYACIFKQGELKDSTILEMHYQVRPAASPNATMSRSSAPC